ncbi:AAC-rich mRNA clone AAC11 protein isoform X2 [Eurosta solidaginis]|uniref:AAC-rich mRNA clone AAC11 protein isoform X2 n=1 Tax=Eurosta solidaginis TaxID=178769 RepID=UPI0035315198
MEYLTQALQIGNTHAHAHQAHNALHNAQQQQQQQHHQQQQHQAHLQLLQNVQHAQQQQQQQHQQQQQQLLGNMQTTPNQTTALPPLSSLPLQVVHNLPHLLAAGSGGSGGGGGGATNGGSSGNSNSNNNLSSSVINPSAAHLSSLGSNLVSTSNLVNSIAAATVNSTSSDGNTNPNNNNNVNTVSMNAVNTLSNNVHLHLRNTMQNVANTQLQQTINTLGNNLVGSLPPSSQLLHHRLQHLANVNNAAAAVVAVAANNINNMNNVSNGIGNGSGNVLANVSNTANLIALNGGGGGGVGVAGSNNNNNNNNNPATPNNNLSLNGLAGIIGGNNGQSNGNGGSANDNNNSGMAHNNSNAHLPNGVGSNNTNGNNNIDETNRWTQFQVQQLWKQHASYLNGKSSSNNKDVICGDDKYKEEGDLWNVEAQTAFLGPNLWDKTLPYDADLKYADLDEFLSENNIPDGLPGTHLGHSSGLGHRSDSLGHAAGLGLSLGHITTKRERSPSPSDCISPETLNPPSPAESLFASSAFSFASSRDFDPRTRAFSDEELKPQPMIKKSRKQFVPDELKDDKYWARRRKNNIAAKRSRDARRQKENQIAMRARYLEKENATLHQEVEQLKQENMDLRARLSKFQDV